VRQSSTTLQPPVEYFASGGFKSASIEPTLALGSVSAYLREATTQCRECCTVKQWVHQSQVADLKDEERSSSRCILGNCRTCSIGTDMHSHSEWLVFFAVPYLLAIIIRPDDGRLSMKCESFTENKSTDKVTLVAGGPRPRRVRVGGAVYYLIG
jgi:hypothetical protein